MYRWFMRLGVVFAMLVGMHTTSYSQSQSSTPTLNLYTVYPATFAVCDSESDARSFFALSELNVNRAQIYARTGGKPGMRCQKLTAYFSILFSLMESVVTNGSDSKPLHLLALVYRSSEDGPRRVVYGVGIINIPHGDVDEA